MRMHVTDRQIIREDGETCIEKVFIICTLQKYNSDNQITLMKTDIWTQNVHKKGQDDLEDIHVCGRIPLQ